MIAYVDALRVHVEGIIDIPDDLDRYDKEDFVHWHVYKLLHHCTPIDVWSLSENARIIAGIPAEKLKHMTLNDLISEGVSIKF